MMPRNKKILLVILILGTLWFFSNYRPTLYLFGVTNVQGYPISLSVYSCTDSGGSSGCNVPNSRSFSPNIPSLYGDYIITTEVNMHVKGSAGRSDSHGTGSLGYSVGACGDGLSAEGCNPDWSTCSHASTEERSKTSTIQVITSTADNTQKCYIDGVFIGTAGYGPSGIAISYSVSASSNNYAYGSASLTANYLTIEDTSSKRFVEYNIYDTFDEPTLNPARWTSSGSIDSRFGKIYLNGGTINMLENMKGRIVYLEYETTGIGSVSIADNLGNSYSLNLGGHESGVIKLETSPLDTNKMYWFFRGKQVKEIDYSAIDKVTFSISGGNVFIDNVGFRILFQTCSLNKNQFLAYETFTGPRTISHYSARKTIQQYCINLPPTLKKGTGFEEVPELIGILANGKTYNVAEGNTVILPYIYTKTDTETLPCTPSSGQIFNVEKNTCEDISGITFFCSEGVWNPNSHSCEIYPEIKYVCDGTLDVTDPFNPICLWHPPEQAVCNYPDSTYDYVTGKCLRYPPSAVDCEEKETYDPQRDACVSNPISLINCPINTAYDSILDKCVGTREIILNNKTIIIQNESYKKVSAQEACSQSGGKWDTSKKICILKAPQVYNCPTGSSERLIGNQKVCLSNLPVSQGEPGISGGIPSIPLWIWGIIIFIFAYFVFEIGPSRGFFRR